MVTLRSLETLPSKPARRSSHPLLLSPAVHIYSYTSAESKLRGTKVTANLNTTLFMCICRYARWIQTENRHNHCWPLYVPSSATSLLNEWHHLGTGFTGRLCLCRHGPLELHGQLNILYLHPLHFNTPHNSGFIQGDLSSRQYHENPGI